VALDGSTVYVAGFASGALPGQPSFGGNDAFVRQYDDEGNELWTQQFGTIFGEQANGVAADCSGLYVAGFTSGTLPGQTSAGGNDAFVIKFVFDSDEADTDGDNHENRSMALSGRARFHPPAWPTQAAPEASPRREPLRRGEGPSQGREGCEPCKRVLSRKPTLQTTLRLTGKTMTSAFSRISRNENSCDHMKTNFIPAACAAWVLNGISVLCQTAPTPADASTPESTNVPTQLVWSGSPHLDHKAVSPDGRYLAGVDWDTGNLSLYEIATGYHTISAHPDGNKLLIAARETEAKMEVWALEHFAAK